MSRLLIHPWYQKAEHILAYMPLGYEVDTRLLLRTALRHGKKIYLPRVNKKAGRLEIGRIRHFNTDLRPGAYRILEPKSTQAEAPSLLDLIIVPGLGFDPTGRRLGRGGGYYDIFLKGVKRAKKMGLAFREQLLARIPASPHDEPVDCVITD